MPTLIKIFPDGTILEFDNGSFDGWCVYVTPKDASRFAPKDVEYFAELARLGTKYGHTKLYTDFMLIFERTTKNIDRSVLDEISLLSKNYPSDEIAVEKLLSILYAGMVAEENKANTKLGKKVKRLGVHQVLIENVRPETAAVFSKGMAWQQILREYEKRVSR
jgi:hypothetical protein